MTELRIDHLIKDWGATRAVNDVPFVAKSGTLTVLLGPSGCGKSTILRMIAGLETVEEGQVRIDGRDITHEDPAKRGVSMVFQSYALFPHLDVRENILFGLKVRKVGATEREKRLREAAEMVGLQDFLQRKPSQLSGGQRQRVALARTIVSKQPICLMDEPLSNLDAKLRAEMRDEIHLLQKSLKLTMIYVTHDQIEAMTMADKIVVLHDGVIEQVGSPMELYHNPKTKFVAGFIGHPNMNFLTASEVKIDDGKLTATIGDTSLNMAIDAGDSKEGDDLEIGIRPEDLVVSKKGGVPMNVDVVEHIGATVILYGSVLDNSNFCAVLPSDSIINPGDEIHLTIDPNKCHAFNSTGQALKRI